MSAGELKAKIDALHLEIAPKLKELDSLKRQLDEAKSREWIMANGVTVSDVQASQADGRLFLTVWSFREWLSKQTSPKHWCEWNGRIYTTSEVIAGRLDRDPVGWYGHVPGAKP